MLVRLQLHQPFPKHPVTHVKLPFLKQRTVPKLRTMSGVSKYGFSEDDDLIESALDDLIHAVDQKDHKALMDAIHALVRCIKNKESSDASVHEKSE